MYDGNPMKSKDLKKAPIINGIHKDLRYWSLLFLQPFARVAGKQKGLKGKLSP